jgi:hypothetical protein
MRIAKSYQTSINYGEYIRGENQSSHWLGKAKYSYGKRCTKHEIMLEAQVLEQEDCDKGTRQFFCRMLMHVFISLHQLR